MEYWVMNAFITLSKYSEYLFLLGFLVALFIVLNFNLKTMKIERLVQSQAEKDGCEWRFWGEPGQLRKFIFNPELLIYKSDSEAVVAIKRDLVKHGKEAPRSIWIAVSALLIGMILSVMLPICTAFLTQG